MTVHFVYRSHYDAPSGLHHRSFPEATVLDWFRSHWEGVLYDDHPERRVEKWLGAEVYGFGSLLNAIAENELPPPRSERQLAGLLEEHLYLEGELLAGPHLLQMLTDDDEIQMAYYFFDDAYLAKHGRRAALLLNDGWRLPGGEGDGEFKPSEQTTRVGKARGKGTTYLVFNDFWDSGNLDDIEGGYRIEGIRLPELVQFLARHETPDVGCCFHYDMNALRSQLFPEGKKAKAPEDPLIFAIRAEPKDDAPWMIFDDWLKDRGEERSAGACLLERALRGVARQPLETYPNWKPDRKKTLIHVEDHMAQMCRHVDRWGWGRKKSDMYHQWYFFDDLWASAHPDLANALLRYARRWDVLTP
jgi:uncharacterized protein (TIGR02996 family)